MLLPDNIHPEHTVYYNGAFVLQSLQKNANCTLLELYLQTKNQHEISMPLFVLCLDWLYLLNLVSISKDGRFELCS